MCSSCWNVHFWRTFGSRARTVLNHRVISSLTRMILIFPEINYPMPCTFWRFLFWRWPISHHRPCRLKLSKSGFPSEDFFSQIASDLFNYERHGCVAIFWVSGKGVGFLENLDWLSDHVRFRGVLIELMSMPIKYIFIFRNENLELPASH